MDNQDNNEIKELFSNMYDDFFGIGKLTNKNFDDIRKLYKETENLKIEVPEVENVKSKCHVNIQTKEQKDEIMRKFFESIDNLEITETSKNTLKKMIEYARKYDEKITKTYIPFNMRIYSDNNETIYKITDVIRNSFTYFGYLEKQPL